MMNHMMTGAPWCDPHWGWPQWSGSTGFVLVHELEADPSSTSASAFAGAHGGKNAVVEYLVDAGASAPIVEVTVNTGAATADWKDTAIKPGFYVHQLGHLAPGAKVTLTVAAAMAHVRWCETVCC
jgi:hypothetical protein